MLSDNDGYCRHLRLTTFDRLLKRRKHWKTNLHDLKLHQKELLLGHGQNHELFVSENAIIFGWWICVFGNRFVG